MPSDLHSGATRKDTALDPGTPQEKAGEGSLGKDGVPCSYLCRYGRQLHTTSTCERAVCTGPMQSKAHLARQRPGDGAWKCRCVECGRSYFLLWAAVIHPLLAKGRQPHAKESAPRTAEAWRWRAWKCRRVPSGRLPSSDRWRSSRREMRSTSLSCASPANRCTYPAQVFRLSVQACTVTAASSLCRSFVIMLWGYRCA